MHVVVIGAGIVGAACAVELQRDGHAVTIVEPGPPGGEQAASYGNGCWLSPSSVLPVAAPGLWRKVPGWLADPLGPLAVRWSYLPRALPWLWRFLRAGWSWERVRTVAPAMRALVAGCPERHLALAEEAGVGHLIHRGGLLYPFPSRADFLAESESWAIRREQGIEWTELDANELRQREPVLDRRYTFAVHVHEGGHCVDPGAYVAALVELVVSRGGTLLRAKAQGLEIEDGRLVAVRTDSGEIACDRAVIAAGAWSKVLAAEAGDDVPLETERGYHALFVGAETGPRTPMIPSDGKMANVRTPQGLRIAGQVEIAGLEAAPNWKRAEVLRDYALATWPELPRDLKPEQVKVWMGHRPSMPDSLPVIGKASGCGEVVHAFGHGHIGLAAGAMTGRLVADIVSGKTPVIDPAPYAPSRFR
ncbi:MAG: FAD-binding oxidoreductase [Acetobacteraceae bacterium]|nr:FAD-binding oxidoreductase [Acetobacteraceae bacterium]